MNLKTNKESVEKATKIEIRSIAEEVFYNDIKPKLIEPVLYSNDKEVIISSIETALTLAVNQGRKW